MSKFILLSCFGFISLGFQAQTNMPSVRFLVIGSSTAAGHGTTSKDSAWVWRFREYLAHKNPKNEVINLAKGGYSTYELMPSDFTPPAQRPLPDAERNITKALSYCPDGIIVNLPSNDVSSEFKAHEQLFNFHTMKRLAEEEGIPIFICTTQPRDFSQEWQRNEQFAVKDSIIAHFPDGYIDFWSGFPDSENGLRDTFDSGDGIHMNNAGHKVLLDRVIGAGVCDSVCQWKRTYVVRLGDDSLANQYPKIRIRGTITSSEDEYPIVLYVGWGGTKIRMTELKPGEFDHTFPYDFRQDLYLLFVQNGMLTQRIEINLPKRYDTGTFDRDQYALTSLNIPMISKGTGGQWSTRGFYKIYQFNFIESVQEFSGTDAHLLIFEEKLAHSNESPRNGRIERLDESENVAASVKYKNHLLHGKSTWYDLNGNVRMNARFAKGKLSGKLTYNHHSASLSYTLKQRYCNGELKGQRIKNFKRIYD